MTATATGFSYHEWRGRPGLRPYVKCLWSGGPAGLDAEPVLPDGCMDVIWDGVRLFVAGPDTGPVDDAHEGPFVVGVRFRPGVGPLAFDVPAVTLRDARVELGELWATAGRLADMLAQDRSIRGVAALLEEAAGSHLTGGRRLDAVVELASRRWSADPPSLTVSLLAEETGLSERQLHRRFLHAVGYGPKRLQRILRFQAFLERGPTVRFGLAGLAARCGYADQAHLARETAVLAGRTPSELVSTRAGDVRFVQDEVRPAH